jgi:hypothetical protein
MFDAEKFDDKIRNGHVTQRVASDHHPSAPKARVPYCTRSQLVQYLDGAGTELATAHRYLQPDGSLGTSGKPDPKRMLKDGRLYIAWWEPNKS